MCHVLVIEDEPLTAMLIEDALVANGANTVAIVATEVDAVDQARRRRPDFITSDVRLIEGTGPEAVATILQLYGELPVLFITATPEECCPYSPEAVMTKPVDFAEVGRRFRSLHHR